MTDAHKPLDAALDLFVYVPVGLAVTAAEELPKLAAKGRSRVATQLTMARVVGQFAVARGRSLIEQRMEQVSSPAPASPSGRSPSPAPGDDSAGGDDVELSYDELLGGAETNGSTRPALRSLPGGVESPGRAGEEPDAAVPNIGLGGAEMPAGAPPQAGGLTGVAVPGTGRLDEERPAAPVAGDPGAVDGAGEPAAASLAIPGYDSLSASQVVQRLAGLSRGELAAVGAYEEAHRGRRTILNRVAQLQQAQ